MSCKLQTPVPDLREWENAHVKLFSEQDLRGFAFVPKIFSKIGIFSTSKTATLSYGRQNLFTKILIPLPQSYK
jgi:hypothetical protein